MDTPNIIKQILIDMRKTVLILYKIRCIPFALNVSIHCIKKSILYFAVKNLILHSIIYNGHQFICDLFVYMSNIIN